MSQRKEYHKEYYEKNKERILERQKKYNNCDEIKEKNKNYNKEWRTKNSEILKEKKKQYYIDNYDNRKIYSKEYYKKNKKKINEQFRKYKILQYGLSIDEHTALLNNQNMCCAICGINENELKTSLHIDHDHKTSKIRGLLCMKCNRAIGYFNDDINLLKNAIEYLNKNK